MSALEQVVPDGFRQSEIGIFPTDWKINSLAEISTKITDGTHDTPKPIKEGIPFLTAIHVKENNIAFESCYFLPKSVHDEIYKRCNPEYEDILMVNIGAGTGTTALVNVKYPFSLKNVALIKPDKKVSDGRFLNQVLSFLKDEILKSLSAGGAQPFLSLSQIGQINIPSPSKEEQTAIANALSDVDALLTELEKLIAKKQAIKTATMQQLLTGKTRLPQFSTYAVGEKQGQPKGTKPSELGEIPDDWDVITIEEALSKKMIVDQMDGNHGELYPKSHEFCWDGVPYVGATDFYKGIIDYKNCKKLPFSRAKKFKKGIALNGDILFAHNATVGPTALVETEEDFIIISTTATYYRCDNEKLKNTYLLSFFKSDLFVKQFSAVMSQSTRNQVPILAQRKFYIVLPSIEEQTAIANILSDMDSEIQTLEKRLAKTRQIKQGMMQELLIGRIRLPFEKES
jgi:type I restriction enzyme S subunit